MVGDLKIRTLWWPEFLSNDCGREFVAGGLGGVAGVISGHPLDIVRVRQQHLKGGSAFGILQSMVAKEGFSSLFKSMCAPLASISFQNAMVFQTYAILSQPRETDSGKEPPSLRTVFMAGTGTGFIQSFLISPVELLKIRLQLQNKDMSTNQKPVNNKGPTTLAKSILHQEGIKGLFRGLIVTILRDSPSYGVYFWSYEYTRELLHPGCRNTGNEKVQTMLFSGGIAGVSSWLCCYPLDVFKTRLQAQLPRSETKYYGIVDCYNKSVGREGYSVLWRGLGTTVGRAFVVNGSVFAAYEFAMSSLFRNNTHLSSKQSNNK